MAKGVAPTAKEQGKEKRREMGSGRRIRVMAGAEKDKRSALGQLAAGDGGPRLGSFKER